MSDTCANGHPWTEENTYVRRDGPRKGKRECRVCNRERLPLSLDLLLDKYGEGKEDKVALLIVALEESIPPSPGTFAVAEQALALLNQPQREVVELWLRGVPLTEVPSYLEGMTYTKARNQKNDAIKKLRKWFSQGLGEADDLTS